MFPASFSEANAILSRPSNMTDEDCSALSVLLTSTMEGAPVTVSCWKLTQEELDEINRTKRMWVIVSGHQVPPIRLQTDKPFHSQPQQGT